MVPKLKTLMKPTKKGLATRIRKRAQLPPDLLSSEDESEPTLRDMMKTLGTLTTRISATKVKPSASSRSTLEGPPPMCTETVSWATLPFQSEQNSLPPAALERWQGIEEQMRARLAERLMGPSAAYLLTTDEESGQDETPQVKGHGESKGVSVNC